MKKVLKKVVRLMVKFDRYIVKRYLFLETPLYKIWWEAYVASIQKKLEKERSLTLA